MNFKKRYTWRLLDMSIAKVQKSYYTDYFDEECETEKQALSSLTSWINTYPEFGHRSFILVPIYTKE